MNNSRAAVLLYYEGQILNTDEGVTFDCANPKTFRIDETITLEELRTKIHAKIRLGDKRKVTDIKYRYPLSIGSGCVRYRVLSLSDDDDIETMFYVFHQYSNVGVIELYAEVEDEGDDGWPTNTAATEDVSPQNLTWSFDWSQHQQQQHTPCQYGDAEPDAYTPSNPLVPDSPITGVQIDAPGPSSSGTGIGDGIYSQIGLHREYVGDFSEPEDVAELGLNYDNNDSDEDVADNPPSLAGSEGNVLPYEPPSHMRTLNLDAMHAPKFSEYGHGLSSLIDYASTGDLYVGMQFPTKEAVMCAIKHYHIHHSVDYKVVESEPTKYAAKCKLNETGCKWSIRATLLKKKQIWEIRKLNGPHTCSSALMSQDHHKLDSNMICTCILPLVQADPSIPVSVLIAQIRSTYRYRVSYKKAWIAKQKAIVRVFGDWEQSYNDLPKWLYAMQHFVHGTIVELQTLPAYHGSELVQGKRLFNRLFWTFKSCIDGFQFCKPLVQVDGTWLYGKYKGTLLLAIAQDGNNNILPIAFAIVEGETAEGWSFFLSNLRRHVTPQIGICLISDRHESIKSAIRRSGWQPPNAYHVYCIRHIAQNFMKRFNNKEMRKKVVNMGYALTQHQFNWYYQNLREQSREATDWLDKIPKEKWAQAFDGGRRYGHMTTNLAECINSVFKGTRNLPITALVQSTYYRLAELFVKKGKQQLAMIATGHIYSETFTNTMEENRRKANSHRVHDFTRESSEFLVEELINPLEGRPAGKFKIKLAEMWCDCGKFQAQRFPCSHVIAACASVHLDCLQFVDPVYKLENIFNVYKQEFQVIGNEGYWPQYHGPDLCHNPEMRRDPRGRPKSSRIRNEMDLREKGHPKRCGLCRNEGHTRVNCPHRTETFGQSSHQ